VFANSSDADNSNIILTVRERAETIRIVALAEVDDSIDILELSGATHVLPLKRQLGEHLANRVSSGLTRANVIGRFHGLLLAEFPVHDTPLQRKTLEEIDLQELVGVSVVGVWDHGVLHRADPTLRLTTTCVPVVIGTPEQIDALNELLVIYNVNPHPVIPLPSPSATVPSSKRDSSAQRTPRDRGSARRRRTVAPRPRLSAAGRLVYHCPRHPCGA